MTSDQAFARAEAYSEAASHLEQAWTNDAVERSQGEILAKRFYQLAESWVRMARNLQKSELQQ